MAVEKKRIINFLCILVVFILLVLETIYIVSRFSENTAYYPYTHRIFRINSDAVKSITIMHGGSGKTVIIEGEELKRIIEMLNKKIYIIAIPYIDFGFLGWETRFTVKTDKNTEHFYFTNNSVQVKGFTYIFFGNTFNSLLEYIE